MELRSLPMHRPVACSTMGCHDRRGSCNSLLKLTFKDLLIIQPAVVVVTSAKIFHIAPLLIPVAFDRPFHAGGTLC